MGAGPHFFVPKNHAVKLLKITNPVERLALLLSKIGRLMGGCVNDLVEPAFWVRQSEFTQICNTVVVVKLFATPATNKALKGCVKLAAWVVTL